MVVEFDSSRPIFQQLADEFARRIITGKWPPGSKTPSVRELAAEVGANPNTVQRALAQLEERGLAVSVRTSGRFVTGHTDIIDDARKEAANQVATEFVDTMKGLNLTLHIVQDLVDATWNRHDLTHTQSTDTKGGDAHVATDHH